MLFIPALTQSKAQMPGFHEQPLVALRFVRKISNFMIMNTKMMTDYSTNNVYVVVPIGIVQEPGINLSYVLHSE